MRLITRANLDGVVCAVFITTMEHIEQTIFANPKDIEDGTLVVKPGDCIANLPYHFNATLWFDHHDRAEEDAHKHVRGNRGKADSAARLIYEFYESPRLSKYEEMLHENDRIDRADLTIDDVLSPKNWVLLSITLDPFMGLQNFHGYANSIIAAIKNGSNIEQLLDMTDVRGRIRQYENDVEDFKTELKSVTRIENNVIITDSRETDIMPLGNRFIAFALYPDADVQIRIDKHSTKDKVIVKLGKSIFNRTNPIHLGRLTAEYGGGGLEGAAGCSLNPSEADEKIAEIIKKLKH